MAATIDEPGMADYLRQHRQRFIFTLELISRFFGDRVLRVLDVGCAPWQLGRALEEGGHHVDGITSRWYAIDQPNVSLLDIQTEAFPQDDGTYDLVLFGEIIEHLPQSPVPPLREMLRVTRGGGRLILTTPNLVCGSNRLAFLRGRSPMFPLQHYFEDDGKGDWVEYRHNREYVDSELEELLTRTGWVVEELGYFVSYAEWLDPGRRRLSFGRRAAAAAKYVAEVAVPWARDTLYCVATK